MKMRTYGRKRHGSTRSSIDEMQTNDAAYNFFTTHELVEITISRLSAFEIAQMQRVCKGCRDLVKTSSQIRQAVRRHCWLPPFDGEEPAHYSSTLPFDSRLDFDSGLRFRPDVRFFSTKSIRFRHMSSRKPNIVELEISHTIEHDDNRPRPEINGKHTGSSAKVWRMLPLCREGIVVDVIFNSKYKGWRTVKKFGSDSTLADVYEWLIDVRDRRLRMGKGGAVTYPSSF